MPYFIYHQKSSQNISKAPVLADLKNNSHALYNYLQEIDRKLQMTSIKVDIPQYERYCDYIRHIPREYWVEGTGNSVMQREWNKNDADFCYSFVSETILSWQINKQERLYEIDMSDIINRTWIESFDDIVLPRNYEEYQCRYLYHNEFDGYLFYVGESEISKIRKFKNGQLHTYQSRYFYKDVEKSFLTSTILIMAIDINLLMNKPATWEVIICYKTIPFTTRNKFDEEYNIDEITIDNYKDKSIDEDVANIILEYLKLNGELDCKEKAFELKEKLERVEKSTHNLYSDILNSKLKINGIM